ncbi:MAG: hypothetical protein DRP09_14225 [Candidatus Thorarchaeota archaeon]|nr:MAG: hypothetical protein DRP09_14225 [Candidatus Thorarchaeota archaeon]
MRDNKVCAAMKVFTWDRNAEKIMRNMGIKANHAMGFLLVYNNEDDLRKDHPEAGFYRIGYKKK